ncbi:MAG: AEC family transporter [Metallibacterium scheffleri]|uniref:AEC family transporter n=1 Tax=Metallibacterium scheffleri TaxID=993689 RepID=UPI0026F04035|nr:AEC family transporter [Metallibacterium scheffleri]MCK9366530.1 AEC family transporter [Metallibacterium scheffleri]
MPVATFAFLLLLIVIGRVLAWRRVLPERAADTLNLVVLYVNLPAMVLLYASRLQLGRELAAVALLPWLLLLVAALAVWLLARVLRWPRAVTGALLLTVPLGNTSYLGYPLTRAVLGDAALPYAVAYDQFGSFLILSTYGVVVLAAYGHGVRPRPLHILRRVLTFPAFLALLLALAIAPAPLPHWLTAMLQPLAAALLPLVALAIGLQLKLLPDREHLGALGCGLLLKMLALPALALLLAPQLGLHGAAAQAGVLESAMPPMITAAALAAMAGLAPRLAAAMVSYGIVLMLLLLPLGVHWLH